MNKEYLDKNVIETWNEYKTENKEKYKTGARTVYGRLMQLSKEIIVKDNLKLRNEINQIIEENDKLKAKVKEQEEIDKFCSKELVEQIKILLAKYWLTHSNDKVFEIFGCNYVPNTEYQEKAREILSIEQLQLKETLSKSEIKAIMGNSLSYPVS